jgi:integrase
MTNNIEQERRELREEYNSDRFWPLSKAQSDRFHSAAVDATEPKEWLVGLTLIYTGMRNGELCHMRREWVKKTFVEGEEMLKINIPVADPCTGGTGPTGVNNSSGANLHSRGEPCAQCRGQGRDHWEPKTSNGKREITVREQDAIECINWWFDQHEEVPIMHNAVNRRVRRIAERANIERKVTAHDLRDTFATTLVRKEFMPSVIKGIMGHNDTERLNDYFDFVGKHQQQAFLDKW